GYGKAAIEKLTELSRLPIVLEVEPPESSAEAARRVKFYEELGFVGWQTPYIQPAYSEDKSPVPLMLMSKGLAETLECAGIVTALLHRHVYGMKGLPR
ncbi:MAG: GNAT family N-acetyltransferase, partial [Bacteroidales bacterium]|nr:GNAT family N-acetyltransferase [Bacteroidales bacterium]